MRPIITPNYIVHDQTITTLDIETLSLKPNAVIYDITAVTTNVLPPPGVVWSTLQYNTMSTFVLKEAAREGNYPPITMVAKTICPSIMEQTLAGRHVDKDTVKWHNDRLQKTASNLQDKSLKGLMQELHRVSTERLSKEVFWELSQMVKSLGSEEVWANHPQFDITTIKNYFGDFGLTSDPWNFRMEADIATGKRQYRRAARINGWTDQTRDLKKLESETHTGFGDCMYNLAVLSILWYGEQPKEDPPAAA